VGDAQELVTVLGGDEPQPITALAHDGSVGRIVSGKGA